MLPKICGGLLGNKLWAIVRPAMPIEERQAAAPEDPQCLRDQRRSKVSRCLEPGTIVSCLEQETWNDCVIRHETITFDAIKETSTRDRADARQGWLARNSAAPCGDSAKEETPVCGFVNTENNSSLVVCKYREHLQLVGFCKYREQLLCLWFARAESHLPKFTRSNLLNWKSSVAPVQPDQGQVQPVQHQVRPVQRQVQQVQNQVKPVHQALLVQHQIESSSCV